MPVDGQHDRTDSQFEITALLDPQDIEALRLELRRLAKEYGATIRDFQVRKEFAGGALPMNPIEDPALGAWTDVASDSPGLPGEGDRIWGGRA